MVTKRILGEASGYLANGDYLGALQTLVPLEIGGRHSTPVAQSRIKLKHEAYRMGVQGELAEAKRALEQGNYLHALGGLFGSEGYARDADVEAPREIPELKERAYRMGIVEARETMAQGTPYGFTRAIFVLSSMQARVGEFVVPEEVRELKEEAYQRVTGYARKALQEGNVKEAKAVVDSAKTSDLVKGVCEGRHGREFPLEFEILMRELEGNKH